MAVPKTTETGCRDGSVQVRQVIKRLHKQPHLYIFFSYRISHGIDVPRILIAKLTEQFQVKKGWGCLCSLGWGCLCSLRGDREEIEEIVINSSRLCQFQDIKV